MRFRLLSFIAVLLALLILTACGGDATSPATATATVSAAVLAATAAPVPSATPVPPAPSNTAAPTATAIPPSPRNTAAPSSTPIPPSPTRAAPTKQPATPTAALPTAAPLATATTKSSARSGGIAFVYKGNLAVVAADGSGLRLLTHGDNVSEPRWAPDGQRIAFVRGQAVEARIYIIDGAGKVQSIPHDEQYHEFDPRWSPDGGTLAFVRLKNTGGDVPQIMLVNSDGTNLRPLVDGWNPAWAPDGKRIAFAGASPTDNTIDMINSQGQNHWSPIKVATIPQDTSVLDAAAQFNAGTTRLLYPHWSPDNAAIAFSAAGHSGLIVTAGDKGDNVTLRAFSYEGGFGRVYWSPDGKMLAYEVQPASGIDQVATLNLASKKAATWGSSQTGESADTPVWSPDSTRIAFVQNAEPGVDGVPGAGALAVAPADGSAPPTIIVPSGAADPDWK